VATNRAEYWTLNKDTAKWLAAFLKEKFWGQNMGK